MDFIYWTIEVYHNVSFKKNHLLIKIDFWQTVHDWIEHFHNKASYKKSWPTLFTIANKRAYEEKLNAARWSTEINDHIFCFLYVIIFLPGVSRNKLNNISKNRVSFALQNGIFFLNMFLGLNGQKQIRDNFEKNSSHQK
jgi:hypothetical protein